MNKVEVLSAVETNLTLLRESVTRLEKRYDSIAKNWTWTDKSNIITDDKLEKLHSVLIAVARLTSEI